MKALRITASIILVLLGVAVGLIFFAKAIGADLGSMRDGLSQIIVPLFGAPFASVKLLVWTIVLLLSSYFVASSLAGPDSRKQFLSVTDEQGSTQIAVKALEEYLDRSICKMEGICGMRTRVSLRPQGEYSVKLKGAVQEDKNLMNMRRTVKTRTKMLLTEQLGLPEPMDIQLIIGDLKPKEETVERPGPRTMIDDQ